MTTIKINYNLAQFKSQVNNKTKNLFDRLSIKGSNTSHWAGTFEQFVMATMREYIIKAVQYTYTTMSRMKKRDIEDWYQKSLDAGYWSLEDEDAPKFWRTGLVKTGRFMKRTMDDSLLMIKNSINRTINDAIIKGIINMGEIEQSTIDPRNPKSGAYIIRMREKVVDYIKAYEIIFNEHLRNGNIHNMLLNVFTRNMALPFYLSKDRAERPTVVYHRQIWSRHYQLLATARKRFNPKGLTSEQIIKRENQ